MRRIQSNRFKSIGYEDVIQADDGLEPLDQLKSNPDVQLVLMAWKMPNMAGIEAIKVIKADAAIKVPP